MHAPVVDRPNTRLPLAIVATFVAVAAACTTSSSDGPSSASGASSQRVSAAPSLPLGPTAPILGTGGPIPPPSSSPPAPIPGLVVPDSVASGSDRVPFVLLLHGYGGTGASIAKHFAFPKLASSERFIYVAPDGVMDSKRARFWNAGPSCCDFDRSAPDHLKALGDILRAARVHPRVDPDRIFVVGFSNGGFMAHRLACEVEGIAGIASVAGAAVAEPDKCAHAARTLLQIHGDADPVVRFGGGHVLDKTELPKHQGALEGTRAWAKRMGCQAEPKTGAAFDLDAKIPGAETEPQRFECASKVALFKVRGGTHDVASDPAAMRKILGELMAAKAP